MRTHILLCFLIISGPAYAEQQLKSLCYPQEGILYSCRLQNGKTVSICSQPTKAATTSLEFRYGAKGKIEVSYKAGIKNNRRFHANVLPVNPKASVQQMWFDVDKSRYIVTECLGGRCPHSGGLLVYKAERVTLSQPCSSSDHPSFSTNIVTFGSDISDTISHSPLIILDEASSEVDALYPYQLTD